LRRPRILFFGVRHDLVVRAAVVREAIRRYAKRLPPLEKDPLWKMVGADSYPPVAPKDIDKVVYKL